MAEINANRGRKLSLENAKLIGRGATSNVYLIAEDTVVKVLQKDGPEAAEKEIMLSKWAFKQGIPTAISYDVVDVDGHPGLVYESLGRGNLRNLLRDHPEEFESIMQRYVELLHNVNSVVVEDKQLCSAKDKYAAALELLRGKIEETEYSRMKALMDTIPERRNLIHGDCQMKNVRVVGNEFLLIDFETLSCGDPIFELAGLYCCYKAFNERSRDDYDSFFELPVSTVDKVLEHIFLLYFGKISEESRQKNIEKTALLSYMYMTYLGEKKEIGEELAEIMLRSFRRYLYRVEDLKLTYEN